MKSKWWSQAQNIFTAQDILREYFKTNVYMCVIFSNYLIEMHFWRARWLGQLLWNDRSKHICNYINY